MDNYVNMVFCILFTIFYAPPQESEEYVKMYFSLQLLCSPTLAEPQQTLRGLSSVSPSELHFVHISVLPFRKLGKQASALTSRENPSDLSPSDIPHQPRSDKVIIKEVTAGVCLPRGPANGFHTKRRLLSDSGHYLNWMMFSEPLDPFKIMEEASLTVKLMLR